MNDLEQLFANVEKEGNNPFPDTEATPPEPQPGNEDQKEEPAPEAVADPEPIPFHKHPRWIEREQKLQELEREVEELRSRPAPTPQPAISTEIPLWFQDLYGDNQQAWEAYQQHEEERIRVVEERAIARLKEEQQKAVEETQKWDKWVDDQITELEADGHKFDRNKLIKVMIDYSPTDENNNLDFRKGYAIYQALETQAPRDTAKSDARKEIADQVTQVSPKAEPKQKDYLTPAELRNRSMSSL